MASNGISPEKDQWGETTGLYLQNGKPLPDASLAQIYQGWFENYAPPGMPYGTGLEYANVFGNGRYITKDGQQYSVLNPDNPDAPFLGVPGGYNGQLVADTKFGTIAPSAQFLPAAQAYRSAVNAPDPVQGFADNGGLVYALMGAGLGGAYGGMGQGAATSALPDSYWGMTADAGAPVSDAIGGTMDTGNWWDNLTSEFGNAGEVANVPTWESSFMGPPEYLKGTDTGILERLATQEALSRLVSSAPPGTASLLQKLLFGSNKDGSARSFDEIFSGNRGGGGGIFGSGILGGNGIFETAAATAPAMAAINYARNLRPYDTSRLTGLFNQYSPEAQASQFDVNTGLGRTALTDSLARRGVSGSSFGDQSLTNFNTARDLGRAQLINQGVGTQAGIAGQILASNVASQQQKNELYGRALLALSGGLSPSNKPLSGLFGS